MYEGLSSVNYCIAHNISHVTSDNYLIHSHDFYELYYVLSGDVRCVYAGTEYELKPHTFFIFAPKVFHGIHVRSDAPFERYIVHFTAELLPVEYRDLMMRNLPTEETIRTNANTLPYVVEHAERLDLLPLFQSYYRLINAPEAIQECMISAITAQILGRLHINFAQADTGWRWENRERMQCKLNPEMESILRFINQNLTKKLSLDMLSDQFFISKSKLNQLFRKYMNCTAMDYITRRRVNYAQQLLLNGCSASQACMAAGFGDYTTFYRTYSKHMGHTPAKDMRLNAMPEMRNPFLRDEPDPQMPTENVDTIWTLNETQNVTDVNINVLRDQE